MGSVIVSLPAVSLGQDKWPLMFVFTFTQAFMSGVIDIRMHLIDKIIKVLGEGGFSFVYLAQDETSGVSSW